MNKAQVLQIKVLKKGNKYQISKIIKQMKEHSTNLHKDRIGNVHTLKKNMIFGNDQVGSIYDDFKVEEDHKSKENLDENIHFKQQRKIIDDHESRQDSDSEESSISSQISSDDEVEEDWQQMCKKQSVPPSSNSSCSSGVQELTAEELQLFKQQKKEAPINIHINSGSQSSQSCEQLWNSLQASTQHNPAELSQPSQSQIATSAIITPPPKQNPHCQQQTKNTEKINDEKKAEQPVTQPVTDVKMTLQQHINKQQCPYSILLIHGRDYLIHNKKIFLSSPFRDHTHTYLGIKFRKEEPNSSVLFVVDSGEELLRVEVDSTCESLLYLVNVESGERLGRVEKRWIKHRKLEQMELRKFDHYEMQPTYSLATVETQDGFWGQCRFCSTNIIIDSVRCGRKEKLPQRTKYTMSFKYNHNKIIANMGLGGLKASLINCIMFDESERNSFMVGAVEQSENEDLYVVKVGGGLSPLICFTTFLSRFYYVQSYGL